MFDLINAFIITISFLLCSALDFFWKYPYIYISIYSTIFYDRLTMNIKRPNPIQKVLSFKITKQLIKPSKGEDKK